MTEAEYLSALRACQEGGGKPEFLKLLALRRERVKERAVSASASPQTREQSAGAAQELLDLKNDLERTIPPASEG